MLIDEITGNNYLNVHEIYGIRGFRELFSVPQVKNSSSSTDAINDNIAEKAAINGNYPLNDIRYRPNAPVSNSKNSGNTDLNSNRTNNLYSTDEIDEDEMPDFPFVQKEFEKPALSSIIGKGYYIVTPQNGKDSDRIRLLDDPDPIRKKVRKEYRTSPEKPTGGLVNLTL